MPKSHWTDYWDSGSLTSLPMDFKLNYDGELKSYWEQVIQSAPSQNLEVLDVCTGNGAVALLLQELAEKHNVGIQVTAVDAADIDPINIAKNHGELAKHVKAINFIGNCLVENMSATIDLKFDLIVSQYGIEYCDTEQAATNVSKLLKPNGRLVFISHSLETAMHEYMQKEEAIYQLLEQSLMLDAFYRFAHNQLSINGFKNKLQVALDAMSTQLQFKTYGLFQKWGSTAVKLFQMNHSDLKLQRDVVKKFYLKYQYSRARTQDMLQVSDKLLNDTEWYLKFEAHGLKLINHDEIIYHNNHNVGHFYEFNKV